MPTSIAPFTPTIQRERLVITDTDFGKMGALGAVAKMYVLLGFEAEIRAYVRREAHTALHRLKGYDDSSRNWETHFPGHMWPAIESRDAVMKYYVQELVIVADELVSEDPRYLQPTKQPLAWTEYRNMDHIIYMRLIDL